MIKDCVGLVEYVLKVIHSINFVEFSYDKLISYSQLLIDVSDLAGLHEDDNIEERYGSYSTKLIEILNGVHLTPKGTNVKKLSSAFQALAQAVQRYAELSPERDTILKKIQSITDEEAKSYDLDESCYNEDS